MRPGGLCNAFSVGRYWGGWTQGSAAERHNPGLTYGTPSEYGNGGATAAATLSNPSEHSHHNDVRGGWDDLGECECAGTVLRIQHTYGTRGWVWRNSGTIWMAI